MKLLLRKIRKPDNRNETIDFKSIIIGFGLGIVPPIIPSLVGLLFFEKVYFHSKFYIKNSSSYNLNNTFLIS